jgi:Heterokaryon incompatibility protein (HET)
MAGNSIYRPLRDNGHEIRVLRLEPSSDSSDNSLKCRLKYILLHDNSAPTVESTCTEKELKNDSENHSYIANGVNEETSEAAPEAQQMHYATKRYKERKRTFGGKIPCNITPPYIALSYSWGDPRDTVPLQVDGTTMMATRNLRDALIAIRSEPQISSFSVWADAVCINQHDIKERNKEVKRMFEVYRRASRVVIWLGYVPTTWNFFGMKTTGDINKIVPRLLMKRSADSEVMHPGECTNDEILTTVAILDRPY